MYAVKLTNLLGFSKPYYKKARDYADACSIAKKIREDMTGIGWEDCSDFTAEVVPIDDDFDFESQENEEWN